MAPDLDPSLLRVFLVCVASGSISRAAKLLGRSQPTLSEQLRRLEDLFGSRLLVRSRDGVTTTETGERLLPYARRIVELSQEALETLSNVGSSNRHVGVGILDELTQGPFPELLSTIRNDHPDCSIEIASLPTVEMRNALDTDRIQLALGDFAGLSLAPVKKWMEPLCWVASPGFDASVRPIPLILCSKPCRFRRRILAALDEAGVAWRIALESTTLVGVQAAVSAGLGVAALFTKFAPSGLHPVAEGHGLPRLPTMELALIRAHASISDPLVDAVARQLTRVMDGST
jgi:DNA-binding transcriptional LysR family regulator